MLDHDSVQRLQLLLRQLQLQRLGVARRGLGAGADAPLHVLACVDAAAGPQSDASEQLPLALLVRAATTARPFVVERDDSPGENWLARNGFASARVWVGPRDRLACVFFLGLWRVRPKLDGMQVQFAESAFESMAQDLAPPTWLLAPAPQDASVRAAAAAPHALARGDLMPLREALLRVERQMLRRALQLAEGNRAVAARALAVTRSSLYRKLKQHGLLSK
jgi:hypothetical protein